MSSFLTARGELQKIGVNWWTWRGKFNLVQWKGRCRE